MEMFGDGKKRRIETGKRKIQKLEKEQKVKEGMSKMVKKKDLMSNLFCF